jgi:hypothetical protein
MRVWSQRKDGEDRHILLPIEKHPQDYSEEELDKMLISDDEVMAFHEAPKFVAQSMEIPYSTPYDKP